jgi:penicillin amidase
MKKRYPLTYGLLAAIGMATCLVQLEFAGAAFNARPDQADSTSIQLHGLRKNVTVQRDAYGVPYIEAENEVDLFLAQGYVTASDRLWQMDLLRRAARGELAEIFGKAALEEDKRHRRLGFARLSESQATGLTPEIRAILEAYACGVNRFVDSLSEKTLPVEFRILRYRPQPWTPADTLIIGKLMAEDLSTSWRVDIMRAALGNLPQEKLSFLLPESSPLDVLVVGSDHVRSRRTVPKKTAGVTFAGGALRDAANAVLPYVMADAQLEPAALERVGLRAEDRAASNNWVVSGKRTASGKPLLANDPHLAPSVPSIWHLVHLRTPGLHVAGVVFPGVPGVLVGHNDRIAWGVTNLGPDVQDLYLEQFDPDNPRRYKSPSGWLDAEVRHEAIQVRKNPMDPSTETVDLEVTVTRHGPIILEKEEGNRTIRYALRWTALDPQADQSVAFLRLDRARNWREFCDALRSYPGPTQNFVYADIDGHIGYYGAGKIPLRKTGDGSLPYDGSTDQGDWVGFIPFEHLPHVLDPASGIIATANSRVVGRDYPYHLTNEWSDPYRSRRIFDLLSGKQKTKVEDMQSIQRDVYSIAGAAFAKEIVRVAKDNPAPDNADKWNDLPHLLENWDGNVTGESQPALIVGEMRSALRNRLLRSALGAERARDFRWFGTGTFLDRVLSEKPKEWLPSEFKSYADFLRVCWQDARANLIKRLGENEAKWTWGNPANGTRWWKHPLADIPFVGGQFKIPAFAADGAGGNMATVNVGPSVSMRMISDSADWNNTRHGIALGASGDPASPHYKDQLEDWRRVSPRVFPFSREAIAKAAKETFTLTR